MAQQVLDVSPNIAWPELVFAISTTKDVFLLPRFPRTFFFKLLNGASFIKNFYMKVI